MSCNFFTQKQKEIIINAGGEASLHEDFDNTNVRALNNVLEGRAKYSIPRIDAVYAIQQNFSKGDIAKAYVLYETLANDLEDYSECLSASDAGIYDMFIKNSRQNASILKEAAYNRFPQETVKPSRYKTKTMNALRKFQNADGLTDNELDLCLKFTANLSEKMKYCGNSFEMAKRQIRQDSFTLKTFHEQRNRS